MKWALTVVVRVKTVRGRNVGLYLAASLMIDVIKHEVFS